MEEYQKESDYQNRELNGCPEVLSMWPTFRKDQATGELFKIVATDLANEIYM